MHIPFSCQHLSSSAPLFCSPVLRNFLKYLPILTVSTFSSPLDSNPFQSKFMLTTTKLFSSELPTISTVVSVRTFLLPYLIWTLRSMGIVDQLVLPETSDFQNTRTSWLSSYMSGYSFSVLFASFLFLCFYMLPILNIYFLSPLLYLPSFLYFQRLANVLYEYNSQIYVFNTLSSLLSSRFAYSVASLMFPLDVL